MTVDICETIWKKISNARLAGRTDDEATLKSLARSFGCSVRPKSVPHKPYPEIDDVPIPTRPPFSEAWYRIGYVSCSAEVNRVFSDAGTSDARAAAEWYAENGAAADMSGRAGLFQGCYDALTNQPSLLDLNDST